MAEIVKVRYSYNDYIEDLNQMQPIMENIEHIIAIYRGSLPMGVHLSNMYNIPISIIDYQSRDGETELPYLMKDALSKTDSSKVLVLDDIYDSGLTMKVVKDYLESYDRWFNITPKFHYMTIYGKENPHGVNYLREHTGDWIEFWWEILEDKSL